MLTDREYREIAKKILFNNASTDVANSIYKNNIKFGRIVSAVMIADWKWNGKGNKYGFRKIMVCWEIKKILAEQRNPKNKHLSLNYANKNNEQENITVADQTDYYEAIDKLDYEDTIKTKICDSVKLSKKEKGIMIARMLENKSINHIAEHIGS